MLKMDQEIYEKMLNHVKLSYPHECCGVLVGNIDPNGVKDAVEARPIKNLNQERARDRYNMDPVGLIQVEKEAAQSGREIVGIYHSHPDHPSRPSKTDLEYAWPIYSYIIIAIAKGSENEAKCWCLNDNGSEFLEEEFVLQD